MNLSPHFSLAEFTFSETAARLDIDNGLPELLLPNAYRTASMMERIRLHLSALATREIPIFITSGYRCQELNAVIGSRPTSDHVQGLAVDFKAPAFGTPLAICKALEPVLHVLDIGQLILEYDSWVHVSAKSPIKDINRVLTINQTGTMPGIMEA